jgi:hypothetical protein
MAWVQRALESDSIFTDPPLATPRASGSFKSYGLTLGIKAFQERQKPPNSLVKDGFVGSKTEIRLTEKCRCIPPGHVIPKPPPEPKDDLIERVRSMPLDGITPNPKEHERLDCLKSFLLRALAGHAVDDRYKRIDSPGTHRFVEEFKKDCVGKSGVLLARCLRSKHNKVLAPINHIMGEIFRWRGDTTDGCICNKMEECEAGRFFLRKARQSEPESLYACFRNVIEPGFKVCNQPCPKCS